MTEGCSRLQHLQSTSECRTGVSEIEVGKKPSCDSRGAVITVRCEEES